MPSFRRRPSAWCGLGLFLSTVSPATLASEAAAATLPSVVVTATRTPQPREALVADVRVIDAEAIARAGALGLGELLQLEGGVELSTTGGPGQVSGLFIRGANSNHVLLLVDGVRINSATVGTNAFEHLPLAQIERIEILRGPGSSLYGADAIGGVVQVFTKRGERTEASVGAGRWGERQASAGLGRQLGATRLSLQAALRRTDGFSATSEAAGFLFDPDADGYRNASLSASVEHELAAGHSLALRTLATRATTHFDAGIGSDDLNRQRLASTALESRNRLAEGWRSTLRLARGSDHLRTEGSFASFFDTDQDQATWQNDLDALGGQLVAGLEARREKVASDTLFTRATRRQQAVFGGYSASLGAQRIEASLRHDDDSQFGGHFSGRLGWGLALAPQWRLNAALGSAFKAPTFNDLYYPFTDFGGGFSFQGNPALRPERSGSAELAARYDDHGTQAGLTLYRSRIRDLIASTGTTMINVNRARLAGLTLDGARRLGAWHARGEFTAQQADDADSGSRLPRRARRFGSAGLDYAPGPWRLGAQWQASGDRYDRLGNDPARRLGGYGLLHLVAGWNLTPEWSLAARLNNALDKRYELAQGYQTPRRNLFVSLAYSAL